MVTPISGKVENGKYRRLGIAAGWRITTSAAVAVMSLWKATGSRSFRGCFGYLRYRVKRAELKPAHLYSEVSSLAAGVEQPLQFGGRYATALAGDLPDRTPAGARFLGQSGGLLIADDGS